MKLWRLGSDLGQLLYVLLPFLHWILAESSPRWQFHAIFAGLKPSARRTCTARSWVVGDLPLLSEWAKCLLVDHGCVTSLDMVAPTPLSRPCGDLQSTATERHGLRNMSGTMSRWWRGPFWSQWLVCDLHVGYTDVALISLPWLRVPERIRFKFAVLVYTVLYRCASSYLGPFTYVADLPSRRGLRFAIPAATASSSLRFIVPLLAAEHFRLLASRCGINCLPPEVTSARSLATFRTRLKTFLFTESHPDIRLIWHFCVYTLSIVDLKCF